MLNFQWKGYIIKNTRAIQLWIVQLSTVKFNQYTKNFCYNFVGCDSFIESNLFVILAFCETNLEDANGSSNFYVKVYLPSIRKDVVTHIHGLAVYVKEGVFLHRNCLWKTLSIPIFVFYFIHLSYFLFPYQLPFYSL